MSPIGIYPRKSLSETFWQKVDKNGPVPDYRPDLGPCWIWTGGLCRGYGRFNYKGKNIFAYRYSCELAKGKLPDKLQHDHLCRVKACVRPDHIEYVTNQENTKRALLALKPLCPKGHKYDGTNRAGEKTWRKCLTCHKANCKKNRQRRISAGIENMHGDKLASLPPSRPDGQEGGR